MRRNFGIVLAAIALTGCSTLPRNLRDDIAKENENLEQARKDLARAESTVKEDLAKAPDLFNNAAVATEWPAKLNVAKGKLDRADADRKRVEQLAKSGARAVPEIVRVLQDQRKLRQSALEDSSAVIGEANRWLDFKRNLPFHLSKMNEAHDKLAGVDVTPVAQVVEKAERDWPAKKNDLDSRLNAIRSMPQRA